MNNNDLIPGFDDKKDDSLKISIEKIERIENCALVILNGYIDTYNSVFFQNQIEKVIEAGFINLIFDCTSLTYVSSTGIGSFTYFLKTLKPKNGDMVIFGIQARVLETFQILGFSRVFTIKETIDEAVGCFKPEDSQGSVFPRLFKCPECSRQLKALKSGRFRCSGCKTILVIDQSGNVFLG